MDWITALGFLWGGFTTALLIICCNRITDLELHIKSHCPKASGEFDICTSCGRLVPKFRYEGHQHFCQNCAEYKESIERRN